MTALLKDEIRKEKQPPMLYIVFIAEFIMRFSYWGIQSLLVLYLVKHMDKTFPDAYHMYGSFTSLTFIFSILGGFLADKIYGFKYSLITGIVFALFGNVLLLTEPSLFMIGLFAISLGVGIFIPNNSNLLGTLYSENDPRRESGFSIYYVGTNLGALAGPFCYGLIAINYHWDPAILLSIGLGTLFLVIFAFTNNHNFTRESINSLKKATAVKKIKVVITSICLMAIVFLSVLISNNFNVLGIILNIICLATILYVLKRAFGFKKQHRNTILRLMLIMPLSVIFFAMAYQIGDSLVIFTDKFVNKHIFNLTVPTNIFISFEAFFIVLLAPFVGKLWQSLKAKKSDINLLKQISAGFLFTAISFFIFSGCAYLAWLHHSLIPMIIFIPGYAFLAIGELCIMPPIIAAITRDIPSNLKGSVMGLLFLLISYSAYLSVIIASLTVSNSNLHITPAINYVHIYRDLFIIALSITVITFIIAKTYAKISSMN